MHTYIKKNNIRKIFIAGILMLSSINFMTAQDSPFTVEGTVLSGSGQPVPDVTIGFEGSGELPSVTDADGKFTLEAPSGDGWLIVSPIRDFKEQRIHLNNLSQLTIYLTPDDIASGHDVVTMLSQPMSIRNVVAAIDGIQTRDIHHTSSLTVDEYLEGRIPGMLVINRSGDPGSGAASMIRGVNSINASNAPLYVVDGIPLMPHGTFGSNLNGFSYNPLLTVNPLDISKVVVTKDPLISAAYGSKGSNGVIFIETLEPNVTETTIEIDLRGGYALAPSVLIPQLDGNQHKTLMNEVLFTSPLFEEDVRLQYPNLFLKKDDTRYINYQHNTNWQETIFQNSLFSNLNVVVKGGDQIARYGLSFGYYNSNGIIRNTGYEGYNLRFVSRLNMFSWLSMNAGVSLNYSTSMVMETANEESTSPVLASLAKSPLLNPYQYDLEGREIIRLSEVDELGISNPTAITNNFLGEADNYNFSSNLNFSSAIANNLTLNNVFSLSYNVLKEHVFMPNQGMARYHNLEAINVAKATNNSFTTFYNNNYLLYTRTLGDHHVITSSTGVNLSTNQYELDWGLTKNAHENDRYRAIQDGQANLREIGGDSRDWNWITIYEYLNYAYKDRYLLSASISLDGSSRIGRDADNTFSFAGAPFGLFYAVGAGWRVSSEPFMRNNSWLEELKLRFSMGKSGNDDIGEANATRYYQTVRYRETSGLYPATVPNSRLTYETVSMLNSGIDLSVLGNRIALKFDYFMSSIDNMLIFRPIDAYFGYDRFIENGGSMENRGWEFNTFARLIDRHQFKWDIQTSVSSVNNEVTDVSENQIVQDLYGAQVINIPGSPVNSFYGYKFEGVYTTQEEASAAGLINERGIPFRAGDAIYADISGPNGVPDGIINDYDKTTIGSAIPKYFGNFINTFRYNRWTLSGDIQFVSGNEVFNYVRYRNERMTGLENQSKSTLNRWQYDGHQTAIPRAVWNDPIGNSAFSTRWIEDGSFIRVKNITISYRIPTQFLAFRSAEFYFSGNNLFMFSDYLGYDPSFAQSFYNNGIDYGQTPHPRQFIGGVKFGL